MAKKIAIIIERMDTSLGGAERSVSELAEALTAIGNDVSIIAATGNKINKNIQILFPDKTSRTNFHEFEDALKKFLAENTYDIIHSVLPFEFADIYQPRGGSFTEAALRNAASYENKIIASFKKATAFLNFRRTVLQKAEQTICENTNGPIVAALSNYVANQFKEHYHLNSPRITVICNGVKPCEIINKDKVETLRKQIFESLKIDAKGKHTLFLFVANNFRLKGLRYLIKALATSQNKNHLIVAGRDNSAEYIDLANKLGIRNRIAFLNQIPEIENVLAIVDVMVLPTFYDPSSRVVLESLSAGKPVITTSFNGATDLFTNGRHGIVIDSPQDVTALRLALDYFSQPENIKKASDAIISDNLKEKISIARVAKETEALYNKILEKRRSK